MRPLTSRSLLPPHRRAAATTAGAISDLFLPQLQGVLGAMCKSTCLSAADLEALAGCWLRLHTYFQTYSWDLTWSSSAVRRPPPSADSKNSGRSPRASLLHSAT